MPTRPTEQNDFRQRIVSLRGVISNTKIRSV